jgi:hypothetical protein
MEGRKRFISIQVIIISWFWATVTPADSSIFFFLGGGVQKDSFIHTWSSFLALSPTYPTNSALIA